MEFKLWCLRLQNWYYKTPILVFKTPQLAYKTEHWILVLGAQKLVFQTPKWLLSVLWNWSQIFLKMKDSNECSITSQYLKIRFGFCQNFSNILESLFCLRYHTSSDQFWCQRIESQLSGYIEGPIYHHSLGVRSNGSGGWKR